MVSSVARRRAPDTRRPDHQRSAPRRSSDLHWLDLLL